MTVLLLLLIYYFYDVGLRDIIKSFERDFLKTNGRKVCITLHKCYVHVQ